MVSRIRFVELDNCVYSKIKYEIIVNIRSDPTRGQSFREAGSIREKQRAIFADVIIAMDKFLIRSKQKEPTNVNKSVVGKEQEENIGDLIGEAGAALVEVGDQEERKSTRKFQDNWMK